MARSDRRYYVTCELPDKKMEYFTNSLDRAATIARFYESEFPAATVTVFENQNWDGEFHA